MQEETSSEIGKHHWNTEQRLKMVITSGKQDIIQEDLWENHQAGDHEMNSGIICQD
jgi:hypothetical protein